MYCPYLRGKQFANNGKIVPIVEPVKKQVNGLNSAITTILIHKDEKNRINELTVNHCAFL